MSDRCLPRGTGLQRGGTQLLNSASVNRHSIPPILPHHESMMMQIHLVAAAALARRGGWSYDGHVMKASLNAYVFLGPM